jgi:hypothetical protein
MDRSGGENFSVIFHSPGQIGESRKEKFNVFNAMKCLARWTPISEKWGRKGQGPMLHAIS